MIAAAVTAAAVALLLLAALHGYRIRDAWLDATERPQRMLRRR